MLIYSLDLDWVWSSPVQFVCMMTCFWQLVSISWTVELNLMCTNYKFCVGSVHIIRALKSKTLHKIICKNEETRLGPSWFNTC